MTLAPPCYHAECPLLLAQLHPPTGVTHAVSGYFTHVERRGQALQAALPDIIVARGTLLTVYAVR